MTAPQDALPGSSHPEGDEIDEHHYFTMPLLLGGSLADQVRKGPLPPLLAANIVLQVAEAVEHAHQHGIIHRDLKPANILFVGQSPGGGATSTGSPGDSPNPPGATNKGLPADRLIAKVTDFGLARTRESELSLTGEAMGTPGYMPPEQARGQIKAIGPCSDVYGLGAVLYCLLTGRPPFQSPDPVETMRQVCEDEPVPLRRLNPQVPRDVETICLRCLEKDPGKRYASAVEVAEDLGRFERGEPVWARPVGGLERALKWVRRRPTLAAAYGLLLLALVLGLGGGGAVWLWRLAEQASQAANDARERADQARDKVALALQEKEQALQGKDQVLQKEAVARQELARLAYADRLNLAQREWEAGRFLKGLQLLDECEEQQRGWEWHYLRRWWVPQMASLAGHTGSVWHVSFSPDGNWLASASQDNSVRLWDAHTGKPLLAVDRHTDLVNHVSFSPDGTRLASASWDKTVRLWDVHSGKPLLTLTSAGGNVSFSPDGKRLASASDDKTVRLWIAAETAGEWEERLQVVQEQQAALAEQQRDWFAAAFHLGQLLSRQPDNPDLWSRRGIAFAEQDKWIEAAADFTLASRKQPRNPWHRSRLGMALLGGRDEESYRAVCSTLLREFPEPTDPRVANAIAWLAVLRSKPPKRVLALAQNAVDRAPRNWPSYQTLGAAYFRVGDFAVAVPWLAGAARLRKGFATVQTLLFLAMAHHHRGDADKARRYFRQAVEQMKQDERKNPPPNWQERLSTRLLRQEAEALLSSG